MESLELRIFREVAKAGSISKAAENMCYVQSNITAHIKKLESELGSVLLVRHTKGVTLTPDGEKLLSYANSILNLLDKAKYELQQDTFDLRIGATQTLAAYRLPHWLSIYQKQCIGCKKAPTVESASVLNSSTVRLQFDVSPNRSRICTMIASGSAAV